MQNVFHPQTFAMSDESHRGDVLRACFSVVFPSFPAMCPLTFPHMDQTRIVLKYLQKHYF